MADITFVLIETVVSPEPNTAVAPFAVAPEYAAALQQRLTDYWRDMSGARVEVAWAAAMQLQVTQRQAAWSALEARQKIDAVRSQAGVPDGTEIILIANDADAPEAKTPRGSGPYVHIGTLTPATVAHEMGHFFEYRGTQRAGHADVAREFFRDEYADLTAQGVEVLYLTGGSTGWQPLVQALQARLPAARVMRGDRFASVARGLGLHARRLYGAAA